LNLIGEGVCIQDGRGEVTWDLSFRATVHGRRGTARFTSFRHLRMCGWRCSCIQT